MYQNHHAFPFDRKRFAEEVRATADSLRQVRGKLAFIVADETAGARLGPSATVASTVMVYGLEVADALDTLALHLAQDA